MIVKEILLNALANAGHIHDGDSSEADELALALRLFNTEMKFYSSKNLITAYQAVLDVDLAKPEQIIGKYNVRKGRRVFEMDSLPSAAGYVPERDYVRCDGKFYGLHKVVPVSFELSFKNGTENKISVNSGSEFYKKGNSGIVYIPDGSYHRFPIEIGPGETKTITVIGEPQTINVGDKFYSAEYLSIKNEIASRDEVREEFVWRQVDEDVPCEYIPDIICNNMERVVSVMYKSSLNQYEKLRFIPLSQFFIENDDYIYCTSAAGENKVKLLVPDYIVGRQLKIVYNTNMNFQKNDRLELPDNHIALVEIAVTVALLRHDADSDPTRLNNYLAQLKEITDNIEATTVTERRIMRSGYGENENILRSGRFITRHFGR